MFLAKSRVDPFNYLVVTTLSLVFRSFSSNLGCFIPCIIRVRSAFFSAPFAGVFVYQVQIPVARIRAVPETDRKLKLNQEAQNVIVVCRHLQK